MSCRVFSTAATDVRVKRAALEEQSERGLIEQRQVIVVEVLQLDELVDERIRNDDVSESQRREENFAECAGVNEASASIEALQTRQRRRAVAQFRVVVVLDDPRAIPRREVDQREPPLQ